MPTSVIQRAPIVAGGMITTMADSLLAPQRVALDATDVFWVTNGSDMAADGEVQSIPKK